MSTALHIDIDVVRRGFRLQAAIEAAPGQTVAVMGPSGAGKSTLLDALAGFVRPSAGTIRVGDREVSGHGVHVAPHRRGIVLLGQDPRLFPHLSARDNVAFGLRARGVPRGQAAAGADEWLWRVGLPGAGDHAPRELSGGQQQRVALARALAAAPDVLLLDEPLTALDPETAAGIRTMLAEQLAAVHTTTVLVTHDAVDAAAAAQQLVLLEDGRVTQQGPVREVLHAPTTGFGAAIAGLNRVLGETRDGAWSAGGLRLPEGVVGARTPIGRAPTDGPAAALFRPGAVAVDAVADPTWTGALRAAETTSPVDGQWLARVVRLEQTPAGVRVHTAEPAVAADVSVDDVAALGLAPGRPVRLRVAASDVRIVGVDADAARMAG
ncbi:ATP-binding cassette domain-containing protein [Microbacterium sp. zg-YB36]|uniref:sulfate/molybdate ABC transporter ATP-binding protein n=1 Tax=Microbacterium sp. zg-YB36 TaxID=2969407 RepID=UPI00214D0FF1|nr:ATP-binding cassette domain-containing protein [Microbacterium sp. zg-YB36]MDL5351359.1 ATP-binding cassette domain-containing protein [Microbacterium sp. zg-YB36]